jgi:methyl-accepting chemotaxis protein
MDMISTERDLLSQYASSFNQKQSDILQKYSAINDRLDTVTASENDETATLAALQKQLDSLSLSATLDKFKDMKTSVSAKFDNYSSIVNSNNSIAATMYQNLQGTKDLISEIFSVISDLDSSISNMNTSIDNYEATKPAAPVVAPVVPAAAPADAPAAAPADAPAAAPVDAPAA